MHIMRKNRWDEKLSIEKLEKIPLKKAGIPIKVTKMGNVVELQYLSVRNQKQIIRILPGGDHYIDTRTGEVKEVEHHENRLEQKTNLRRTFRRLRGLINANCAEPSRVRWITLTYEENMTDVDRLYRDFSNFHKRFLYFCKKQKWPRPEYIDVVEPQARGAWHHHLLYIFPGNAPFIQNEILRKIWQHGFVSVRKLDDVDNVGAYLTAYLGDMPLEEITENTSNVVRVMQFDSHFSLESCKEINGKRYVKGARLAFYPANMNLYRCSHGVKQPKSYYVPQWRAEQIVKDAALTYQRALKITDAETGFETILEQKYYNVKRRKY